MIPFKMKSKNSGREIIVLSTESNHAGDICFLVVFSNNVVGFMSRSTFIDEYIFVGFVNTELVIQ